MSARQPRPDEQAALLEDEADLILPTQDEPYAGDVEEEAANHAIVADEVDAAVIAEPLFDDSEPASVGILNAFQGIFDKPSLPRDGISLPTTEIRPFLRREGSGGPDQSYVPPPPPPLDDPSLPLTATVEVTAEPEQEIIGAEQAGTDSLSLQQLRALVRELPGKAEPAPYAFAYGDKASLMEELEEWFSYTTEERERIAQTYSTFAGEWARFTDQIDGNHQSSHELADWLKVGDLDRKQFISKLRDDLAVSGERRLFALESLVYLALGSWYETAGLSSETWFEHVAEKDSDSDDDASSSSAGGYLDKDAESKRVLESQYHQHGLQIEWLVNNTIAILQDGGIQAIVDVFKAMTDRACQNDLETTEDSSRHCESNQRELWCAMTLLYVGLEVTRSCRDEAVSTDLRKAFVEAKPNVLVVLGSIINCSRWDESIPIPLVKLLLLTWKATLVLLGGLHEIEEAKKSFREPTTGATSSSRPVITATPLHYHSFRQEITSKYPAYVPPLGKFPLEPEQKSILPPLRQNHNAPRSNSISASSQHGGSIYQQPVHIATPAPSPPPSPAAGKGGKKQNYQTNQLFPFLYPPLDVASNSLGGKGTTFLQDSLVGRKWEGADIPISILEASELFSSRIRATRAMKQMWDAREDFLRFERGWVDDKDDLDITDLKLDHGNGTEDFVDGPLHASKSTRLLDGSVEDRLETVDDFYRDGLSHLQSIIVVVLKTILSTLTSLITNPIAPLAPAPQYDRNGATQANGHDGSVDGPYDLSSMSLDDLDTLRAQEITAKAASGIILLLLKWFKISHVLKFEYMCQLLVDANYIPIILKLLQSQEIERIVNCKVDRRELNLFPYCQAISRNPAYTQMSPKLEEQQLSDSSEDECAPPPIKRFRDHAQTTADNASSYQSQFSQRPEVDELGLPTTELPSTPITHYSWRNFFSSINFLRVLQKICKHKAHRNLMLVQYKSAAFLKKALRIPQRQLRLYTLKLFKNQVPYCGRKWRQSNMRVITAVYLHCRPELRDDWLLSADVDADVELAVPMEQSLRALTHYYNLKHYRGRMGVGGEAAQGLEERDFFERELDKLEWAEEEGEWADGQGTGQQMWESGMEHL